MFHSSWEETADIADWNILKKQVVLYEAMEMLIAKFVTEKRMPYATPVTKPTPIILSWAMSQNVAKMSPRHVICLQFDDVSGLVTTFGDV